VGDGVYAGCYGQVCGEGHGEFDVVDDGSREDLGVAFGRFAAMFGLADGGSDLAANVSGRDAHLRHTGAEARCFAKDGGAAATNRDRRNLLRWIRRRRALLP